MAIYNFSNWWDKAAKEAGIDDVHGYTINWDNDIGPNDEGYWEWWEVLSPSGEVVGKFYKQHYAIMVCAFLNEQGLKNKK